MADLVRSTLRLRPDRIIVDEARGAEALDMLKVWNTGHPGGIATVHATAPHRRSGITDFRWHDLRHIWASWLRQNDVPAWVLQELADGSPMAPYADQLTFSVTTGNGGQLPFVVSPEGHKNGHSSCRARLKLVAGTDLSR